MLMCKSGKIYFTLLKVAFIAPLRMILPVAALFVKCLINELAPTPGAFNNTLDILSAVKSSSHITDSLSFITDAADSCIVPPFVKSSDPVRNLGKTFPNPFINLTIPSAIDGSVLNMNGDNARRPAVIIPSLLNNFLNMFECVPVYMAMIDGLIVVNLTLLIFLCLLLLFFVRC